MSTSFLPRLLLAILPAMILTSLAFSAIWGQSGLVQRHRLKVQLQTASAELATLERENQRLLRELQLMEEDSVVMERMVAEELGWAAPGATIYRFDD